MNIIKSIGNALARGKFKVKKHSPEIYIAVGVASFVGTVACACVATTHVNDILDEAKDDIEDIHERSETQQIDEENEKRELARVYIHTGVQFVKLYAPAAGLGVLSIFSFLASHNIMRKRNFALAAAYTALDTGWREYRGRVVERFGEDIDNELRYGLTQKTITHTDVDENGNETTVEETATVIDNHHGYSPYARFFDECSREWKDDAFYNKSFLLGVQTMMNNRLIARKVVLLNEVYEALGIPLCAAGNVVGWVYDPENKNSRGDNFIDFHIFDGYREVNRDFVNGYEKSILLDFNVQGNVLEYVDRYGDYMLG